MIEHSLTPWAGRAQGTTLFIVDANGETVLEQDVEDAQDEEEVAFHVLNLQFIVECVNAATSPNGSADGCDNEGD